ncbi:WLM domain-containing protein [Xylariaceae sp. FL0804]|nr:WLM domain-containing protein [Xylariaceae sp. FL0804]
MPVGIQRLNAKKSQPNDRIIFIKPLKGPDEAIAQDYLERIAAQCLPIMKQHHLSVMTLEEYEPNREFVGRNFNAGEVVQLVLKSPSTGRWLPFNYVQMVMMHELAHCKQMNHSRAFWAVRNLYAEQLRTLWANGYTGDGLWGRGASLRTGAFEAHTVLADEALPEHLCGGTYRSRRRKRKRKANAPPQQQLSHREREERRIRRKFGASGVALGEDDDVRAELERGRRTPAKPRVAGSKRGRELRAAAALARFDQQQPPKKEVKEEEEDDDDDYDEHADGDKDGTASDAYETASDSEDEGQTAVDVDGRRLLDGKGHKMVRVCEEEDPEEDGDAQDELRELSSMSGTRPMKQPLITEAMQSRANHQQKPPGASRPGPGPEPGPTAEKPADDPVPAPGAEEASPATAGDGGGGGSCCPLCSYKNEPGSATCGVCAHVLDSRKVLGSWKCDHASCAASAYLNAGDSGVCGLCGGRKCPGA